MKRFLVLISLCFSMMMVWAQVDERYDKGSIPVVNGRVLFQESVINMLSKERAYQCINEWAKERFSKPNVIVSKFTSEDETNHTISFTAEEYLVFTSRFFVLDRTRINYWVEIQCADGCATIKMTRINYWYEEERDGGLKFSAEDFITDDQAFNRKGVKMLKDQGKFRRGTVDFFDSIVAEMTQVLNN